MMKKYLFILSLMFIFNIAYANKLKWPIDCIPNETCSNLGYPDIDGDGIAFNCDVPGYTGHEGTDISASKGTDVFASLSGEVLWVFDGKYDDCPSSHEDCQAPPIGWGEPNQSNGYRVCTDEGPYFGTGTGNAFWCFDGGNVVVIRHPNNQGVFATRYDHLKTNSIMVSVGDTVEKGQKIAEVASAGHSTEAHLHFEVWGDGFYKEHIADPWVGSCGSNTEMSLWENGNFPWLANVLPKKAVLISPLDQISNINPTYSWNAVSNSSWYYLWVNDSTGNKIKKWYTASQASCADGVGVCSVTPSTTTLASGTAKWWIQTWNTIGYGQWSRVNDFNIAGGVPISATLLNPEGVISENSPTYSWNAVSNSSWYYLWVNDSTGNKIKKWYTASQASCADGTGVCSVTPSTTLASGTAKWWVQTWNTTGYGQWSHVKSFNIEKWLSASDYQEEFNYQLGNDFYPKKVYGKCISSSDKYRADFAPFSSQNFSFSSIHGAGQEVFSTKDSELKNQGYQLTWVQSFSCFNKTIYQATWEKLQ